MWQPYHRRPNFLVNNKRSEEPGNSNLSNMFLMPHPETEKLNCENVFINGMEIGHSSMQGYRNTMEDEHIIEAMESLPDHTLVAVMDGHAGKFSAEFTSVILRQKIEDTDEWQQYAILKPKARSKAIDLISRALVQAYRDLDADLKLLDESGLMDESGCTCVCAVITPTHVICANTGDSRCVVGTASSSCISLTEDHKPSLPDERRRIEQAGGFVMFDRVNGELAMSRALGDFRYKSDPTITDDSKMLVICYPDISVHQRTGRGDELLVLACDGVWDVMTNKEVVDYLTEIVLVDQPKTPDEAARRRATSHAATVDDHEEDHEEEEGVSGVVTGSKRRNNSKATTNTTTAVAAVAELGSNKKRRLISPEVAETELDSVESSTADSGAASSPEEADSLQSDVVTAQEAAESLIDLSLSDGSTDNLSAVIVRFL